MVAVKQCLLRKLQMERWADRVAVVTGASSGIGASIAEELVKKGVIVVGLARRVEKVQELSTLLKSEPGKLYPRKCDVTQEDEIEEAFDWVKSELGGVDILVNNAGCSPENSLIDGPTDVWRNIFELNVLGLSICTKLAVESMRKKGTDGHIVHINSLVGHISAPADFPIHMYAASKHAVTVLAEGLRRELVNQNSRIRVTSVSPAVVATEIFPTELLPLVPHLQAKDIADAVLFVLGAPAQVEINELIVRPLGSRD